MVETDSISFIILSLLQIIKQEYWHFLWHAFCIIIYTHHNTGRKKKLPLPAQVCLLYSKFATDKEPEQTPWYLGLSLVTSPFLSKQKNENNTATLLCKLKFRCRKFFFSSQIKQWYAQNETRPWTGLDLYSNQNSFTNWAYKFLEVSSHQSAFWP